MSRWLTVNLLQSVPMDLGLDANGRAMFSGNALITKTPGSDLEEEVVGVLEAAGLGTLGTNLFATSKAQIPNGDGPFLGILATGGAPPINIHNVPGVGYERATVQLIGRGEDAQTAKALTHDAMMAVARVSNQTM